jgi:hypothetical protein
MDENETKSSIDLQSENLPTQLTMENPPTSNGHGHWTSVKSEPVCVFVNRNFDSSDSEHPSTIVEGTHKTYVIRHHFFLSSILFIFI